VAAFRKAQTDSERFLCMRDMYRELGTCLELAMPLPPVSPVMQAAWDAFQRDLPQLLKEKPGWWVLYHGDKRLGINKDDRPLYRLCDEQGWPSDEIVVFCVEPIPEYDTIGCSLWYEGDGPTS
jgi:hypothetical protein